MIEFYDWGRTMSYDADVTMVVSMRSKGKTYGLRLQFVQDYLKRGSRFVEICRFKDEIPAVMDDYFARIDADDAFPGHVFKANGKKAWIARRPPEGEKPRWECFGYFVALTQMQTSKKKTYVDVDRILFDEAIIDKSDRYHGYLPNEFTLLANVVSSCTRERPGDGRAKPHVYLLGNACDLTNPYFARYGIREEPAYGYSWHAGKTFLLHYVEPGDEADAMLDETVAGRMVRGTAAAGVMARNEFTDANLDFIASKPKRAKFHYGIRYRGETFGVWVDWSDGLLYVNDRIPNNANAPIYALTASDNGVNYIAAKRADKTMRSFVELYYLGCVRYENAGLRARMMHALSLFGVR